MKSPTFRTLFVLFGLALAAGGLAPPAHAAKVQKPKEWTVLVFMNGKNDLEPFAIQDFAELAAVGSTKDVDFVVQLGRPESRPDDQAPLKKIFGGWSGARRFLVAKGSTPAPGKELEIVGSGPDLDMGDPKTLADFFRWGKSKFPAHRYAVVIWNHGQGYRLTLPESATSSEAKAVRAPELRLGDAPRSHRAVSEDADTGSIIYNTDVRAALDSVFGPELRLVGFDACLMGMIETAYELRGVAPIMVASEELEPGDGWNYTSVAKFLTNNPTSNEDQFAIGLVASYGEAYGDSDATTLSAVRLSSAKQLARELSALSDALVAERGRLFPVVNQARAERAEYNDPQNPVTIDLIGFLEALEPRLADLKLATPALAHARRARELAAGMVISNYSSSMRTGAFGSHGIAIYFPASKAQFNRDSWSDGYRRSNQIKKIDFVASEKWSSFLEAYLGLPQ